MNRPIKEVKFNQEATDGLVKGINLICDAVASTMGYRGRTVLIESAGGLPIATKDGVTVAKSIFLDDAIESLGCEFIKQACEKTVNIAGDGTSSTSVLAQALINLSFKKIKEGKVSPIDIKNGLEIACKDVIEIIKGYSIPVKDAFLFDVAKISSNNDDVLGKIISDAFIKVGSNGVVSYEKSETSETFIDFIGGMPIDRGWEFEGFVNKPERRSIEFSDSPLILLSNRKIQALREILPILEYIHKENKELLIISEMEYDVMKTLYANKKNGLKIAVIMPPSIAEKRRDYLTDISLATGGLVVDIDTGTHLETYDMEVLLGKCDRLTSTKDNTVLFFNEKPNQEKVMAKIEELNTVISTSNNPLEKEYLQSRISKLACGVSVIKVGGNTEVELNEKIDRVDDAIHAVRASIAEGVVQGGGIALLNASFQLNIPNNKLSAGYHIVQEAIKSSFRTILFNAGVNYDDIEIELLKLGREKGYDVNQYKIIDMIKGGIIDPTKVIRASLENAISVATTVLMTNTVITHKRDRHESNI